MTDIMESLYAVVENRKASPVEGSYTCYLFDKGIDKILKKVGEECAETIIAAKNGETRAIAEEAADVLYHLTVMLSACGVDWSTVRDELSRRTQKIGNLKEMRTTDKES